MSKRKFDSMEKEQQPHSQDFFRKLDEPIVVRRSVLEASKATLSLLKGIYTIQEIRQKKLAKLSDLQKSMKEIRLLIQKAEELMPKYSRHEAVRQFPHLNKPKHSPHEEKKSTPVVAAPAPKPLTELDRLKESINKIDKKINELPDAKSSNANNKFSLQPETDDLGKELGKALDKIHKKLKEM